MQNITKLEKRLWEAADQLRANSKLTQTEYSMPVLGLIFLRYAYNRFLIVEKEITKNLPTRAGKTRTITKAELADIPGLVKLVDVNEIEENDYSLTPGRYVGVAPEKEDEDFDFEQTMQEIHTELGQLNDEAVKLAEIIQSNFEELGI